MSEKKVKKFGTREEVFAGTAQQTKGGLTKDDLFESKGRFVSKRASEAVNVRAPLKSKKTAVSESEEEEVPSPVVKKEVQKIEEKLASTTIDTPVKATRKRAPKAPPPTPEVSPVVDEPETPAPTKSKKKRAQVEPTNVEQ